MGHTKNEVDLVSTLTSICILNSLTHCLALVCSMNWGHSYCLTRFPVFTLVASVFPKHLSIPFAGSGAVFHHIDGSVEADRALFHARK